MNGGIANDIGRQEALIQIRHLKKSFGKKEVLKDVNLDLYQGENIAIIGRSGQGKSVTIKCIVGLIEQDGGSVTVMGKEIRELSGEPLRSIRVKVGFLFQGGALYDSMSVRENLAFPLLRVMKLKDRNEINARIEEMLDGVKLREAIDVMPSELSGGMRKRVALARTLILKPDIILCDEPTTGLDPLTSREISELIVSVREQHNSSWIIITHDMQCAKITAGRMLVLEKGEFITEGAYSDLERSDNELVRAFFE